MPAPAIKATIPASYVVTLLDLCQQWGVSAAQVLEGGRVDDAMLREDNARLALRDVNRILERAIALTGEPALAYHLAPLLTLSAHGLLGFGAMASATARDAIRLVEAFGSLRIAPFSFHLDESRDTSCLRLEALVSVPVFYAETVLLIIYHAASTLLGELPDGIVIQLKGAEPNYYPRYAGSLAVPLHYQAQQDALCFPASLLDRPLPMAAGPLEQLARAQCEKELAELQNASPLQTRIKNLLRKNLAQPPDLDAVALHCRISSRTLKRQLAEGGNSYGQLLDELRLAEATRLMAKPRCSLKVIAQDMGFSNQGNFSRAFRRWTGMSPREYMQQPDRKLADISK